MTVPDGVQGITAGWLSAALGRAVTEVSAQPIGTGQTGSSYRLTVTWADGGTSTFVAKTGAEDPDVRERKRALEVALLQDPNLLSVKTVEAAHTFSNLIDTGFGWH